MSSHTIMFYGGKWQIIDIQSEDGRPYITDGENTYYYEPCQHSRLTFAQRNELIMGHVQDAGHKAGEFYYCQPERSKRQSKKAREHALRYHKTLI